MALQPGTLLGPYEILLPLGTGGMGEVYRARDTKLNRDVAIKVLLPAVANDPERMARFSREAQVLASLNHPHIAQIHGLEESSGVRALVMEFVDGDDLTRRIARGALPPDEALAIARQIADALEAAHEQGIVHRDLKPANVKVRADGTVKVLDFGLAKALEGPGGSGRAGGSGELSQSPTITTPAMTQAGMLLGTAAYMSPEQARGAVVDKRTDIWAFGVVCVEMLIGRRLFEGGTVSDTIAAVLRQDIDWRLLPAATPAPFVNLLRRCLERDPKRRLRDIGEARIAIEAVESGASSASSTATATPARPRARAALLAVSALATVALAAALVMVLRPRGTPEASPIRVTTLFPAGVSVDPKTYPVLAISRDGSTIAFAGASKGVSRLYVRRLGEFDAHVLPETEGATVPFFSPDGTWLGFFGDGKLKKTPVAGGPVITLAPGADVRGGVWTDADTIIFSPAATAPINEIPASGGASRSVTELDQTKHERTHRWPSLMPDQKTVLFNVGSIAHPNDYDDATIEAVRLDTRERRVVMQGGRMPRYVASGASRPSGDLLYVRGKILYAVAFDEKQLQLRGRPRPIVDGVMGDPTTGSASFAVSDNGTLAYLPGDPLRGLRRLAWVDLDGKPTLIDLPPALYADPHVSPDERRVAFSIIDATSSKADVWVADTARGTSSRLTVLGVNRTPIWSRDGRRIFYTSYDAEKNRTTFEVMAADASGAPQAIGSFDGQAYLDDINHEGSALFLNGTPASGAGRPMIYRLPTAGAADTKPTALVSTTAGTFGSAASPDGRRLAYVSNESGRYEIVVQLLAAGGGRTQVSNNGGFSPRWSPDGRTLYYLWGTELFAASFELSDGLAAGKPRRAFGEALALSLDSQQYYDMAPDGRRFLMLRPGDDRTVIPEVRLVLNWFTDLRRTAR